MQERAFSPVAIFDISDAGVEPVADDWPDIHPDAGYRWIHLDINQTASKDWAREKLPEIAARALLQSETRPRCERLEEGLILNLRGVNLNPESSPEDMVSLRMWITPNAIVTARLRKVWAVEHIRQSLIEGTGPATVGAFLAELAYGLTSRIETVSLALEEQTDELEDIVSGDEKPAPEKIGSLRQTVIKMRRFINPQRDAVAALASQHDWILTQRELALLRETSNRTRRIVEELDATRDRLSALQDHITAEQAQSFARNSYLLSIVAAIFLPLGFLTGLFGVNVAGMPGTDMSLAFWLLAAASGVLGLVLFIAFKFFKWL